MKLSYKSAGVDLWQADRVKRQIRKLTQPSAFHRILANRDSFGGFFRLDQKYKNPVLVSSTDGVGTKLKIAFMANKHSTVGEDLVNHCVNDILVHGARPLFFLDYIATGKLYPAVGEQIGKGLVRGCSKNNCSLIGGETAEMPDFYEPEEYDLAGFIVGIVEKKKIIDGSKISPGDLLLGLGSNGLHTNGYSLARKVLFSVKGYKAGDYIKELKNQLGKELLKSHRSYSKPIFKVLEKHLIKGMAHITGGGIPGNLIRILPEDCQAKINVTSWRIPQVLNFIQKAGNIESGEMFRVFNMGIGLILVVPKENAEKERRDLLRYGEKVFRIGEVDSGERGVKILSVSEERR